MPPSPPLPTRKDWLSIAALGVIWGGTFMVVSFALRGYGPVTVATARVVLGATALIALAVILRRPLPAFSPSLIRYIIAIGILTSALPFMLLSWGQQTVTSAFAGLSMAAVPLFVLPLAHFFGAEPLTSRKALGFGLGFVGAAILLGPDILAPGLSGTAATQAEILPRLACLTAPLCYASGSVLTRRCPPIDPISLAALSLVVGSVVLLPVMLMTEGLPQWAGAVPGTAIILLGLVPTAFAALLRVSVIRSAGSGFMTLTSYQVPIWSMVFGATILGEALPLRFFAALGLILIGLVISQRKPKAG
jgi:drug/metabolite transporter (DMT)-like permease